MNYLPIRFKSTAVVESDSAGSNGDDFNGHRGGNYHNLDATKVTETLECLGTRIHDRFPNCGLKAVCGDLTAFSRQIRRRAQTIIAPNYWLRLSVGIVVVLSLYVLIYLTSSLIVLDQQDGMSLLEKIRQAATGGYSNNRHDVKDMAELMQAIITIVTFIAASMIFLVSIERRLKRRQILHDLHELRSFTHVIDMHQLTKSQILRSQRICP